MSKISNDSPQKSIYDILGIEDKTKSSSSNENALQTADEQIIEVSPEDTHEQSADVPSGSLFDNYSLYTDGDPSYWRWFRALSITGIGVIVVAIVLMFWKPSFSGITSSTEYAYSSVENSYEEPDKVEIEEETAHEEPSSVTLQGTKYFKGKINGKYAIHMQLNIDESTGKYYYDKSGAQNCMSLEIKEMEKHGNGYYIKLEEYNANNEYCGYWEGSLENELFKGVGNFLGKEMPFSLTECSYFDTDF